MTITTLQNNTTLGSENGSSSTPRTGSLNSRRVTLPSEPGDFRAGAGGGGEVFSFCFKALVALFAVTVASSLLGVGLCLAGKVTATAALAIGGAPVVALVAGIAIFLCCTKIRELMTSSPAPTGVGLS